ncbi:MAG: hypothetical protein ACP5IL_12655, partial [Syntrophobacteraceae bacterium]
IEQQIFHPIVTEEIFLPSAHATRKDTIEHAFTFEPDKSQLETLKEFLIKKRDFVLSLFQNANLLEHDSFTDLLWALSHLTEELEARASLDLLPSSDLKHLGDDIQRAFMLLTREWIAYMRHLEENYPFIYSLSVRTNPFNPAANPVVLGN